MNARELIDLLRYVDPEDIVTIWNDVDGSSAHIRAVDPEEWTVALIPGDPVTEEDLT